MEGGDYGGLTPQANTAHLQYRHFTLGNVPVNPQAARTAYGGSVKKQANRYPGIENELIKEMIMRKTSPKKGIQGVIYNVKENRKSPQYTRSFVDQQTPTQKSVFDSMRATDFGSKGLFKPTTTHGGKATLTGWIEYIQNLPESEWKQQNETVKFKDVANLNLAGTTFDSHHMSRFINESQFVTRVSPQHTIQKSTHDSSWTLDHPFKSSKVSEPRESVCFTSIDRYKKGQMSVFLDQDAGPSMLLRADEAKVQAIIHQKRMSINDIHSLHQSKSAIANFSTLQQPMESPNASYHDGSVPNLRRLPSVSIAPLFTSEKKDTSKIRQLLNQSSISSQLNSNVALKTVSQQREEHELLKKELRKYQEVKERHLKSIKADRMIRSEWKYGLIGEAAKGSPPSQEDLQAYRNQQARSVERQKRSLKVGGVSNQIQFAVPTYWDGQQRIEEQSRQQSKVVDITNDWTGKRISPIRFKDTHSYLFSEPPKTQAQKSQEESRRQNLVKNDKRQKGYQIINISREDK